MTGGAERAALDALHSARPIVARLGTDRTAEEVSADLIAAWSAVETGLRSLVGGSALSGQLLIRELRQRHFLTLEQANALAEFHAARERAGRAGYVAAEGDINAARSAFLKLESGLMAEPVAGAPSGRGGSAPIPPLTAAAMADPMSPLPPRSTTFDSPVTTVPTPTMGRPTWLMPVVALLVLVLLGGLAWALLGRRGGSTGAYDEGVIAYREGRREAAAGDFMKAARDNPNDPMPHVYLARMAREANNLNTAQQEAVKAVQLGPANAVALRELGSVSYAQQNFDSARRFYIRALQADGNDRLSQGYLGCSLVRMGRLEEGNRWLQRAGSGAWSNCAPAQGAPGARAGYPAQGYPQQQYAPQGQQQYPQPQYPQQQYPQQQYPAPQRP